MDKLAPVYMDSEEIEETLLALIFLKRAAPPTDSALTALLEKKLKGAFERLEKTKGTHKTYNQLLRTIKLMS